MQETRTHSTPDRQKQVCEEGLRFLRAWNISAADALFAEAVREFPSWSFPQDGQALTSVLMGDLDRATGYMINGLELKKRDDLYDQLVRLDHLTRTPLSRKDRERVITVAKEAQSMAIKEKNRLALHGVGVAFLVGGDYRLAEAAFGAALNFGSENCSDCIGLSLVHAFAGRHLDAWAAAVRGVRGIQPWILLMPDRYLLSSVDTRFLGDVRERFEASVGSVDITPRLHAILCIMRFHAGCHDSVVESCCIATEHFRKTNEPELAHIVSLYESASMAFMAAKRGAVDEAVAILKKVYLTGNPHNTKDDDLIHGFVERCLLAVIDDVLLNTINQMKKRIHECQSVMKYCAEGLAFILRCRRGPPGDTKTRAGISVPAFYRMTLIGTIGGQLSSELANAKVRHLVNTTLQMRSEVGAFVPLLNKLKMLEALSTSDIGRDNDEAWPSGRTLKDNTQVGRTLAEVSASLSRQDKFISEGYLVSEFARDLTPRFEAYADGDFYKELFPDVNPMLPSIVMASRLRDEMVGNFWSNPDDMAAIVDSFLSEVGTNDEQR